MLRLSDLRDRAGVGATRADRARARRQRLALARRRHRPRGRVVFVLVRSRRDRQEPLPEGRVSQLGAGVPVRLDQPRLGARPRALGADRLAVRARRVRRRARDDRCDGGAAARVRFAPPRAGGARARAPCRQRPSAPQRGRADELAGTADRRGGLVGCRAQLSRRLADALEGDRRRFSDCGLRRAASGECVAEPLPRRLAARRAGRVGGVDRADDRRRLVRLLGRQRSARGGALEPGGSASRA